MSWSGASGSIDYFLIRLLNASGGEAGRWTSAGTSLTVPIYTAGTYSFAVSAVNSAGASAEKRSGNVTVYPNYTVTYKDWDGKILEQKTVPYGGSATMNNPPSREGYTFNGWDRSATNVTSNLTITAQYIRKKYSVTFYDSDKKAYNTQSIYHGEAASAPADPAAPAGYKFVRWDRDFSKITANTAVYPVFVWENPNLPVVTTIQSVAPDQGGVGYYVNFTLKNNPDKLTQGRMIISLKTKEDKLVASIIENFSLPSKGQESYTKYIPYDKQAKKVEISVVQIVDNDKTGIPLAPTTSKDINYDWSGWSTQRPEGNVEIESKTEYRYADKQFTTSGSSSLAGWNHYNTTSAWNTGGWSGWSDSPYYASSSSTYKREVQTQSVYSYTQYQYSHFAKGTSTSPVQYSGWSGIHYCGEYPGMEWLNYPIAFSGKYSKEGGKPMYGMAWCPACNGNRYFYNEATRNIYKTQYRYRDSSLVYTYHFWKWGGWSSWSANAVSATSNRQVETRTLYRYRSKDLDEDTSGEVRQVSGNVGSEYSGRKATLMIYKGKNTDPTQSQLEYVAQTTLDANGGYAFSLKTKEEPTLQTGDFTILLGIEAATSPIYIDTIQAPVPEWTVKFVDEEGQELAQEQKVRDGEAAVLPATIPEKEGYRFVGWDQSTSNIKKDTVITAEFEKKDYYVIFLDAEDRFIESRDFKYGDLLSTPEDPQQPGYQFSGWDTPDGESTTVTENMVIRAQYTPETYTLTYYDWAGNVIKTESVEFGQKVTPSATAPARVGMVFEGWSGEDELERIERDVSVFARYSYPSTVSTPEIKIESQSNTGETVSLQCDTPNADIYYAVIQDDISSGHSEDIEFEMKGESIASGFENAEKYTGPIALNEGDRVVFQAFSEGKNESQTNGYICEGAEAQKTFSITFNPTGGSVTPTSKTVTIDETYGTLPTPTRDGFTFDGWYTAATGGSKILSSTKVSLTEDQTLYAHWNAITVEPTDPVIEAKSKAGSPGSLLAMPIILKNNPGVASIRLSASYDADVLELISSEISEEMKSMNGAQYNEGTGNPAILNWIVLSGQYEKDGTFGTLNFKIKDTAESGISTVIGLSADPDDLFDKDDNAVNFTLQNGTVNVISYIPGDVNGDQKVNNRDAIALFRYVSGVEGITINEAAGDVNKDGKINNRDAIMLFRYVSGVEGIELK